MSLAPVQTFLDFLGSRQWVWSHTDTSSNSCSITYSVTTLHIYSETQFPYLQKVNKSSVYLMGIWYELSEVMQAKPFAQCLAIKGAQ